MCVILLLKNGVKMDSKLYYTDYSYFISYILEQKTRRQEITTDWIYAIIRNIGNINFPYNSKDMLIDYISEGEVLQSKYLLSLPEIKDSKRFNRIYSTLKKSKIVFNQVQSSWKHTPELARRVIDNLFDKISNIE